MVRFLFFLAFAASACAPDPVDAGSREERPDPHSVSGSDDRESENLSAQEILLGLGPIYLEADLANGRRLWSRCSTCHTLSSAASSPLPGTDLRGVLGAQAGGQSGFDYSEVLREADFIWTADRLDFWLASPDTFLPGNRMSFSGVSAAEDRRDLIACIAVGVTCIQSGP